MPSEHNLYHHYKITVFSILDVTYFAFIIDFNSFKMQNLFLTFVLVEYGTEVQRKENAGRPNKNNR